MKPPINHTAFVLLFAILASAGLWYAFTRPADEDAPGVTLRRVDARPSSEFLNVRASIDYYRERIAKNPESVENYVQLAQLYMQEARVTAQESKFVPLAERLLARALRRDPTDFHARAVKGTLLNTLHRFEEARTLGEELISAYPHNAFVHGILVDALVELGEYQEAVAACDRMLSLRPGLPSYARAAYLRELHGDIDGAVEAMTLAARAGVPGRADRAWALAELGRLLLAKGDLQAAAEIYAGILEERPRYAYAVAGLGRVKLAEQAFSEAVRLLREAYDTAPSDAFLEPLAEAYAALGDSENHAETRRRIEQGFRRARAAGHDVRLELADYLADGEKKPDEALRLARQEYERRPNHVHVLETYAWALFKNGRVEEALAPIERAMRLGTVDAKLQYRAGVICEAAGRSSAARRYLRAALDNLLHVESPLSAREAEKLLERL